MKQITVFIIMILGITILPSAVEQSAIIQIQEEVKSKVYYFHNTRRCPTCLAIEKETRAVLKEEPFVTAKENGQLEFKSFNAENTLNKELVKKLGVTGSALIVIKGGEKTDLTSKGFMYALKQPDKFRQMLRDVLND